MHFRVISSAALATLLAAAAVIAQSGAAGFEIVSVSSAGVQGNNASGTGGFTTPNHDRAALGGK